MRVVVANDAGLGCAVTGPERFNLREEPGAIERIDAVHERPALHAFLLNLNSDESPFATFGCKVWTAQDQGAEPNVFASRIDLMISQGENPGHALYEEIAARLAGLLEREPGDALRAELHVSPAEFAGGRTGFCLRLFLFSRAATEEQAELRWNLGLARVQQALLFIARAIRQRRLSLQ